MPPISKIRYSIAEHAARMVIRNESRTLNEAIRKASKRLGHKRLAAEDRPNREDVKQQISILADGKDNQHFIEQQRKYILDATREIRDILDPEEFFLSSGFVELLGQRSTIQPGFTIEAAVPCSLEEMEERICDADLDDVFVTLSRSNPNPHRIIQFGTIDFVVHQWESSESDYWKAAKYVLDVEDYAFKLELTETTTHSESASILSQNSLPWVLLERLESVRWNTHDHPEGDMMYHSLQVFELGRNRFPIDLEFLEACLLHDVGYVVDPKNPRIASAKAVAGFVSERTRELISRLDEGHEYLLTGHASRGLRNSDLFDDLVDLARFDLEGRVRGAAVLSLEEAHEFLNSKLEEWE